MKKTTKLAFVAFAASSLAASAATVIPLANASLDNATGSTWGPDSSNFFTFPEAGRTTAGGITTTSLAPNDGTGFAILNSGATTNLPDGGDSMYQTVTLVGGQQYNMTFAVATSSLDDTGADNGDTVDTTFAIAIYTSAWASVGESAWTSIAQDGDAWTDFTYTFTADTDGDYNVGIRNYTDPGDGSNVGTLYADNARLETVPEPSSAALLGLGGLALILRRRK